jgi:glucose 1-dehydrogenase
MKSDQNVPPAALPSLRPQVVLAGQKALVTGASSGIGKQVAIALGHAGADVAVNYITDPDKASEAVKEIERRCGVRALAAQADVSNEEEVRSMFETICRELGTIDILVNNAGLQQDAPIDVMTLAQWKKVIDVNLTGQFLCAREAIREFKRRGVRPEISCSAGKIICMSSVHDTIPWAGHVNYAASKGGVMLMMKSIAQEVAALRIRVNAISPGAIRTPINMQAWETPEAYAELLKLIPYKRIGEPEDVGRAAVWLASDYSDYINGICLYVDGGMTFTRASRREAEHAAEAGHSWPRYSRALAGISDGSMGSWHPHGRGRRLRDTVRVSGLTGAQRDRKQPDPDLTHGACDGRHRGGHHLLALGQAIRRSYKSSGNFDVLEIEEDQFH